jgi:hypothetical protein
MRVRTGRFGWLVHAVSRDGTDASTLLLERSGVHPYIPSQGQLPGIPSQCVDEKRALIAPTSRSGLQQVRRARGCPPLASHGPCLLCPLLTSADPSPPVAEQVATSVAGQQISRDKPMIFRPAPAGSTPGRPWGPRVSLSLASSPGARCLLSGFCSSGRGCGLGFFQTPPRGDALALA